MSPLPPPTEHDTRRSRRRYEAQFLIGRAGLWWFYGQLATFLFGLGTGFPVGTDLMMFLTAFFVLSWLGSLFAAAFGAIVTLRAWPLLPNRQRFLGLAPWAILVAEVSPVLIAMAR